MSFPSQRGYLWDNTAVGGVVEYNSAAFVPKLHVSALLLQKCVENCIKNGEETSNCLLTGSLLVKKDLIPGCSLVEKYEMLLQDFEEGMVLQGMPRAKLIGSKTSDDNELPISVLVTTYCKENEDIVAYDLMCSKLVDTLCSPYPPIFSKLLVCRSSCAWISSNNVCKFSLDLVIPSVKLTFSPISPLKVESSNYFQALLNNEIDDTSGVITMDKFRRIILNTHSNNNVPLIGLWIRGELLDHKVFSACIWYKYSTILKDKVSSNSDSEDFMIVLIKNSRLSFFRVEIKDLDWLGTYEYVFSTSFTPYSQPSNSLVISKDCVLPSLSKVQRFRQIATFSYEVPKLEKGNLPVSSERFNSLFYSNYNVDVQNIPLKLPKNFIASVSPTPICTSLESCVEPVKSVECAVDSEVKEKEEVIVDEVFNEIVTTEGSNSKNELSPECIKLVNFFRSLPGFDVDENCEENSEENDVEYQMKIPAGYQVSNFKSVNLLITRIECELFEELSDD